MTAILSTVLFLSSSVLYLAGFSLFFLQVLRRAPVFGRAWLGPAALSVAASAHLAFLLVGSLVAHVCPVESVHVAISVASLAATLAFLFARLRWPLDVIGIFVAPVGLVTLLSFRILGLDPATAAFPPLFLTLHIAANLMGDGFFLLAAITASLYLYAERRLKARQGARLIGRLPSLDLLDRAEHRFLLAGFPLLTLGIVSGTAWASRFEASGGSHLVRAIVSYLTWTVFAAVLGLRAAAGWRGRRAALGTLIGFVLAVLVLAIYLARPGGAAS